MYRDKHYTFKILWYWSTFHFDIDMLPQYGKSEQLALNEFFSYQQIMTSLSHYSLFKLSFLAIYSECPVLSLTMHIYINGHFHTNIRDIFTFFSSLYELNSKSICDEMMRNISIFTKKCPLSMPYRRIKIIQ